MFTDIQSTLFTLRFYLINSLSFFLDVWFQFDGVLNPIPETSVIQRIKSAFGYESYEKKLEKQIIFAANFFFPKWSNFFAKGNFLGTGTEMKRYVDMLYSGLKKNVFDCCKKWRTERDFKAFLGKVFF